MIEHVEHEPLPADAALSAAAQHDAAGRPGLRRLGVVLLAIAVVSVSVLIGVLAFAGAALLVPVAPVMFGALIVVGVLAAFGLSLLVFSRTRRRHAAGTWWRRTRVSQVTTAATAVVVVGLTMLAYVPLGGGPRASEPKGTNYADVSTGSRLAYWKTSAEGASNKTPIVFLTGGPGGSQNGTVPLLDQLAEEGFDIYFYDQAGTGHSDFLEPEEYTMERWIADLDAFRAEVVGAESINIIGHSFGGYFAEAYAAAHPEAVEKVILATPLAYENSYGTPTAADEADIAAAEAERGAPSLEAPPFATTVHLAVSGLITEISQEAADSYMPQEDYLRLEFTPGADGLNFIVNIYVAMSAEAGVQDVMEKVKADALPTLILRSENDYIQWPYLRAYRDVNPNATMVYIPERDHNIFWDGSEETSPYDAVRTFLLDEPQAGEVYKGSRDPRFELGDD